MTFKIQVVFEAEPESRFRKFSNKLDIGKLIFIAGFLDLDDNEIFVEAKEMDLLDDSISNQPNATSKSPFLRTNKFKSNINIKKEKKSDNITRIIEDNVNKKIRDDCINISDSDTIEKNEKQVNYRSKRKSPTMLVQNQKKLEIATVMMIQMTNMK